MPVSQQENDISMTVKRELDQPGQCGGCGKSIRDRFYLMAADRQWHDQCLRCQACEGSLDAHLTCFSKDGNIYCKRDYFRLFGVRRCARCSEGITSRELIMRARDFIYHVTCFTCAACDIPFAPGDTCAIRDNLVYCQIHYKLLLSAGDPGDCSDSASTKESDDAPPRSPAFYNGAGAAQKGRPRKKKTALKDENGDSIGRLSLDISSLDGKTSLNRWTLSHRDQSLRTKRMRTSFKHHQMRSMKSYFAINQNPDAKDLKGLAQKTGLSKRVLQVWFQNARAKWRRGVMRQEGQNGVLVSDVMDSLSLEQELTPIGMDHGNSDSMHQLEVEISPMGIGGAYSSPELDFRCFGADGEHSPNHHMSVESAIKTFRAMYNE